MFEKWYSVIFITLLPADVIGFARGGVDLAALKIQNRKNLPHLSLAASTAKVGYPVFAIGSPLAADNRDTCTQGNISRIRPDGIYLIIANSSERGETGNYSLRAISKYE